MPNPLKPLMATLDSTLLFDRLLATLIRGLLQNGFTLVADRLVRIIRGRRGDDPVQGEQGPARHTSPPPGPFRLAYSDHACDLLIFVPRSLESYLIDNATGSYGYSHVAVDCGEVDTSTGKRVFVEATPHVGVHRSYLDNYGQREFIRIPLAQAGVNCREFRDCILSKVGQPYDVAEVLTWGQVDDPAKQVCSDLAADCLPARLRRSIVWKARTGKLGRHMVSIHGPASLPLHIFVSPNGFAKFFGAPKGHKIDHPDELVRPRIRGGGFSRIFLGVAVGIGLATVLVIGWKRLAGSQGNRSTGKTELPT
jgi:hypothetical protein